MLSRTVLFFRFCFGLAALPWMLLETLYVIKETKKQRASPSSTHRS
jgi:hypothetical protein